MKGPGGEREREREDMRGREGEGEREGKEEQEAKILTIKTNEMTRLSRGSETCPLSRSRRSADFPGSSSSSSSSSSSRDRCAGFRPTDAPT